MGSFRVWPDIAVMLVSEKTLRPTKPPILEDRILVFAVEICKLVRLVEKDTVGKHVGHQLFRAATSAGANYAEAQDAESRRDFLHKMQICLKELRETYFFLRLVEQIAVEGKLTESLLEENDQLIAIFVASVKTAKRNEFQNGR